MEIEKDAVRIEAGLRRGKTLGSPLMLRVENRDHRIDDAPPVTRPRPGHADLAGMMKFGTKDAREVLERSSARETVARVAAGAVCASFLEEMGVHVNGYTVALGRVRVPTVPEEEATLLAERDASPFYAPDAAVTQAMIREVDAAAAAGDTLGGVFEVRALGVPPGLGTNATWEGKLEARLAAALLSIPAIKGFEVGDGFAVAGGRGSDVHDHILPGDGRPRRGGNRAGGIEGGMTNGEPLVVRAAMKPLSSLARGLPSVDVTTGETSRGARERSDVTAVPAASVVGEAMVAFVLADALLEKTGGDSLTEVRRNLEAHLRAVERLFEGLGRTS
jgi:chorismate synthase